jgi:hypothetical protein
VRIPVHIGGKNVGWMELKPDTEKSLAKATMGHKVNPTAGLAIRVDTMEIVEVDLCWSPGIALSELEAKYQELLGAVESKHEGETRHQTALRYITERETRNAEAGQVSLPNV